MNTALMCLALAIYFEARSEPVIGQIAVAQVILKRVEDPMWPNTICEVVWQNKQFSFTHDGKSDNPTELNAWNKSIILAKIAMIKNFHDYSKGSDHYHTKQVNPYWSTSSKLEQSRIIGNHIFYRKKPDVKQRRKLF